MKRLLPYALRVELRRLARGLRHVAEQPKPTRKRVSDVAAHPCVLVAHSSKLLRRVAPELMPLQANKVHNLRLACARLDGLLLEPGDLFSFCSTVGRTSRWRGYLDGLEMHKGKLVGAPGGGLCQLSNLIYWMALHLDLAIVERHHHGLDLFPDDDRAVPFGMGATVFYNYVDFRFRNTLDQPLVLKVSVEPPLLCGSFYSDRHKPFEVEIADTYHRFFRDGDGVVWRENRVAKHVSFTDGRPSVCEELAHNVARVCYEVPEELVETSRCSLHCGPGDEESRREGLG